MTEEQKELLIAKMLDSPSSLSDEEIDVILHDDELREICEMSSLVSAAYHRLPEIDAAEEWERFRPRMRRKPSARWRIMRVAAGFIGVVLMSSIMVKVSDSFFIADDKPVIGKAEPAVSPSDNDASAAQTIRDSVMQREEPPVLNIPKRATSAPKRHIAKAETTKPEKMKQADDVDVDVDEYLRIRQARIDNEFSMMAAAEIDEKYGSLLKMLELIGESDNIVAVTIRKTTAL